MVKGVQHGGAGGRDWAGKDKLGFHFVEVTVVREYLRQRRQWTTVGHQDISQRFNNAKNDMFAASKKCFAEVLGINRGKSICHLLDKVCFTATARGFPGRRNAFLQALPSSLFRLFEIKSSKKLFGEYCQHLYYRIDINTHGLYCMADGTERI